MLGEMRFSGKATFFLSFFLFLVKREVQRKDIKIGPIIGCSGGNMISHDLLIVLFCSLFLLPFPESPFLLLPCLLLSFRPHR